MNTLDIYFGISNLIINKKYNESYYQPNINYFKAIYVLFRMILWNNLIKYFYTQAGLKK